MPHGLLSLSTLEDDLEKKLEYLFNNVKALRVLTEQVARITDNQKPRDPKLTRLRVSFELRQ